MISLAPKLLVALAVTHLAPILWGQVVLSEFGTGTPDFVEIHNRGTAAVDVSGWTLASWYGATPSGPLSAEPPFALPTATILQPGGFVVLEELGVAGVPGSLPASITTGINYAWSATRSIEIALSDGGGQGVDYVFRDCFATGVAPHAPPPTSWSGILGDCTGDHVHRIGIVDTDTASDWRRLGRATAGAPAPLTHLIISAPSGPDCIVTATVANGTPGNLYLLALTGNVAVNPPPSGWFLGIDILQSELSQQLQAGPPFVGILDGTGSVSFTLTALNTPCPLGFTVGCVAAEFLTGPVILLQASDAVLLSF